MSLSVPYQNVQLAPAPDGCRGAGGGIAVKGWIWVPVALLIGLVAGAVGPRAELRKAREDVARLQKTVASTDKEKGRIEEVLRMLQVPKAAKVAPSARRAAPPALPAAAPAAAGSNAVAAEVPSASATGEMRIEFGGPARHRHGEHPAKQATEDRTSLSNRIQQAVELWRLRSDIARSTLIADAGLNEAQAQDLDVLLGAMNLRLGERIGYWAGELARTNYAVLTPETGVRMMNDLTGALVLTYDELDRKMPAGWRTKAGEGANLLDFIDPAVAAPLIGVEQKLQTRPRRSGPDALESLNEDLEDGP